MSLIEKFKEIYKVENQEEIQSFFAPGRVNLIGEHTDYNGGHVFPCALSFGTHMLASFRNDKLIKFYSLNLPDIGIVEISLEDLTYKKERDWANYPIGVIDEFIKAGHKIDRGLNILVDGNVPAGSGLSSSASLEVVTGGMLREMFKFYSVTDIEIALLGQKAENNYCKMNCGIMDQFASANGRTDCAIFLDCATLKYDYAPLHLNGYKIVIVNSNVKHALTSSGYNTRRAEAEAALKILSEHKKGIKLLGELTPKEFNDLSKYLKDDVLLRRARHAVLENARTIEALEALKKHDLIRFGQLMNESGDSLRYDYEVTCQEQDVLVDLARKQEGVLGARMTGGGFGGCTVNLVKESAVENFVKNVASEYKKQCGIEASIYLPEIGDGVKCTSVDASIKKLVKYGLYKKLISREDEVYVRNQLLRLLKKTNFSNPIVMNYDHELDPILNDLLQYAIDNKIIDDDQTSKDLFDTLLMDCLVARPSVVIDEFIKNYRESPKKATNYFYKLNCDSNYVRTTRIAKDIKFTHQSPYGDLDITINLSKPEKDPKAIANALKNKSQSNYPKCLLCKENLGYAGHYNHPARENIRYIPLVFKEEKYYLQYSPYSYYNEHCIVFNETHKPMIINEDTLYNLIEFVDIFPHYMIGSNADLPIVGGSILTHDHYQGGAYDFPMFRAQAFESYENFLDFKDCKVALLYWPLSVVRVYSKSKSQALDLSYKIIKAWNMYEDKEANIIPFTDGTRHNTVTPVVHKVKNYYAIDIVLRNNRTDEKHPDGVFHVDPQYFNIKKENIGVIEVLGLAILPSRLLKEIDLMIQHISLKDDLSQYQDLIKHKDFISLVKQELTSTSSKEEIKNTILKYVGDYFQKGLECCGVFKQTDKGREQFKKFIKSIK